MGMTKPEVMRITIYEAICNNVSAVILGFFIGLFIALSLNAQFMIMAELPFKLMVNTCFLNLLDFIQDLHCSFHP